jgi:DeoR/GlpR family transcriptional regulator of sugar metabolism
MFGIERLQAIRVLVKEKKSVEVTYLSKELNVSEVTIRRDLDKLEKEGLVEKTYGGAILIEKDHGSSIVNPPQYQNDIESEVNQIFSKIAGVAAKLIEQGDTVFIGGSTMGIELVKCLVDSKEMIVVTNNIEIGMFIYKETNHKLVMIGGEIDMGSGNVSEFDQLDELLIEKAFITADGVDLQYGYTVNEKNEVRLYKKLEKVSRDVILVVPSERYDKRGLTKMAPLSSIMTIVSDKEMPDEFKAYYFENNIKVHTSMLN